MTNNQNQKVVLTIAGSDSGGGAGVQADLKTFTALRVYGSSVLTCVTSQNTVGVDGIHAVPSPFVRQQLESVMSDLEPVAIKTGMLLNKDIIMTIVACLKDFYLKKPTYLPLLVVDPVMVSSSGHLLLSSDSLEHLKLDLLPLTYILTPNIPEALELLDCRGKDRELRIKSLDDLKEICKKLALLGPTIILLKGGHLPFTLDGNTPALDLNVDPESLCVLDVIYMEGTFKVLRHPYYFNAGKNSHGTGCTLSAAIVAFLALDFPALEAIEKAVDFVQHALKSSFKVGKGLNNPLNHFHAIGEVFIPLPSPKNLHPFSNHLMAACKEDWKAYIHHPFVLQLKNGTLPQASFKHFIIQDYHYLLHYARAHALAASKCSNFEDLSVFANIISHISSECQLHVKYCEGWGISLQDLLSAKESVACVAYTRYVMDVGSSAALLDLRCVLAPCLIGYGEIGRLLMDDPSTVKEGNPYYDWIANYGKADFQEVVLQGIERLESEAHQLRHSYSRLEELEKVFHDATRLEVAFFDAAFLIK